MINLRQVGKDWKLSEGQRLLINLDSFNSKLHAYWLQSWPYHLSKWKLSKWLLSAHHHIALFVDQKNIHWCLSHFFFFWLCQILVAAWQIFSCSLWDLVSLSGIKPRPSALGMWSLRDWTTREILVYYTSTQLFYLCLSVYSILIIFQIKDLYNHLEH